MNITKSISISRVVSHVVSARALRAGILTLSLTAGTMALPSLWAQPDVNNAPKAANPENRQRAQKKRGEKQGQKRGQKRGGKNSAARLQNAIERETQMLEAIAGKPLTAEQKQKVTDSVTAREAAVQAAQEKYQKDAAAIVGLSADEFESQMRQTRRNMMKNRKNADAPPAQKPAQAAPAAG